MDELKELLNIKQAAKLLNVSEISLRRWTDAGRLACVRIGPKRERRFRYRDLVAFMEEQRAESPPTAGRSRAAELAPVLIAGVSIQYGSHLCSLYDGDLGRVRLAVPFLADGLRAGSVCYLLADPAAQDDILTHLKVRRPGAKEDIERGRLVVSAGARSAQATCDWLEQAFVEATCAGAPSLRIMGDMAWSLSQGMKLEELVDFEMRYDQFLAQRFPVVSFCQYDTRRFSGVGVLKALKCHKDVFRHPVERFLS